MLQLHIQNEKEGKTLQKFNILLSIVGAIAVGFAWLYNANVTFELIPTIVNGAVIATSTAIIFTGIFITLGCSNSLLEIQKKNRYLVLAFVFLGLAAAFVAGTYLSLMINDFNLALKTSFTGLIFAIETFLSLMALLLKKIT